MQTIRFWFKFSSLSLALTLEIRSRSPKPNQLFITSDCYSHANLVKIRLLVHEMSCTQETVMPTPTRSTPKTICFPPLRWGDMIMQRTVSSLERLSSKTAPKYCTVSLASMSMPLIEEFKADLDKVSGTSISC